MADLARRILLSVPLLMAAAPGSGRTVFDFTLDALEGGSLSLADHRGRALLLVNTASFCGFTPQYASLQRLHERYAGQGFAVIGVPSNDFRQESAENGRIREFCDTMYGITFPMAAPTHVRGDGAHPLFAWLAARAGGPPRWNFHKYLVARDGLAVRAFPTATEPEAPALIRAVTAALEGRPLV
jgi:glutathione peroxidase